ARAELTPAASATESGEAWASRDTVPMPASVRRLAKTGPIPSIVSTAGSSSAGGTRKDGGCGSREMATEMNRSRIAQMTAAMPPSTPRTLARRVMPEGYLVLGTWPGGIVSVPSTQYWQELREGETVTAPTPHATSRCGTLKS